MAKKNQKYIIEPDGGSYPLKQTDAKAFITIIQKAALLAILDKGVITRQQFDICVNKAEKCGI